MACLRAGRVLCIYGNERDKMALHISNNSITSLKDLVIFTVVASDPATGIDGQMIINSTTDEIKVWYNGIWNTIDITITPGVVAVPVTGNPIGLLLTLTYTI